MEFGAFQKPPTVTRLTSGSGTYSTPAGARRLRVTCVGGGGGGSGGATVAAANAGSGGGGGTTTFGTSLLQAVGGTGGVGNGSTAASTAAVSINSPAIPVFSCKGARGVYGFGAPNGYFLPGGTGASSPLGGAGGPGLTSAGLNAEANSGSGGGGGGTTSATGDRYTGGGGSAGGFLIADIVSPGSSYSYSVGAGGTAGSAGTGGAAGGVGGSGLIVIEEYYV